MSRHHPDLVMCRKQPGIAIGRLCDKCDGKCPVCDSYVRPTTLVRICDECSFGNYQNKCVVCGGEGISDAFYCFECTRLEKDRDGCPKIINLGSSRTDVSFWPTVFSLHASRAIFPPLAKLPVVFLLILTIFSSQIVILPKENESDAKLLTLERPGLGFLGKISNLSFLFFNIGKFGIGWR
ncbi:unnamed protein product [Clonostachys chloroleuca]|uniref:PHD finger-like domain-containing protein 5A n=1 Tax=Clonostachys chloroleuca TaxID=1926264 RepID=A0AA35M1M1_9HYPO|nr:unnamed protein product [Clonostachys chloroleuca]